jgi:hypothetical protein
VALVKADHRIRRPGEVKDMMYSRLDADDVSEYADRIVEAREQHRRERQARRHAFWSAVSGFLLSIPAGIGIRIGG